MPNQIPIDPKLPKNFNDTPKESRSKDELDKEFDAIIATHGDAYKALADL